MRYLIALVMMCSFAALMGCKDIDKAKRERELLNSQLEYRFMALRESEQAKMLAATGVLYRATSNSMLVRDRGFTDSFWMYNIWADSFMAKSREHTKMSVQYTFIADSIKTNTDERN